jgi:hypothetical protein
MGGQNSIARFERDARDPVCFANLAAPADANRT